jgi:uncharacterized membrane protein
MAEPSDAAVDQHLDELLGNLLRIGVLLSAAVVAAGGLSHLSKHGMEPARDYSKFGENAIYQRSLGEIVRQSGHGDSRAIIQLGLILLIGTPIARVIFSVFAFAVQRDYLYVVITLIVLVILLYSLLFDG